MEHIIVPAPPFVQMERIYSMTATIKTFKGRRNVVTHLFRADTDAASKGLKAVEKTFSPEFRNRLDAMVPFKGLTPELMGRIVDKFVAELERNLAVKRVRIFLTPDARAWLAKKGYDPAFGARPLQRVLRTELEDVLAQELLFGKLARGGAVTVDLADNALSFACDA